MDAAQIRRMIAERDVRDWQGLPPSGEAAALLPVAPGPTWGDAQLGADFEPAERQVLEIAGYDRALAYVRGGSLVLFDGANPALASDWPALSAALGPPEAVRGWAEGGMDFLAGEHVFAARGISVWLNPANGFVAYVSLFAPTTVEAYDRGLRPHRPGAKRR